MRTLTVLLLAGAIYSCGLLADMRAYTVTWDANTDDAIVAESNGIDYVAAALNAQDAAGNISGIALATVKDKPSSNFLLTIDETAPEDPNNVTLQ